MRGHPGAVCAARWGGQLTMQCRRTCLDLRIFVRRSSIFTLPPPFTRDVKLSAVESMSAHLSS